MGSGLATAGIISGLGHGLGRGLEQMQAGIIQQGIQQDRFQHDDAAANVEREFQTQKMLKQQEHERGMHQEKMGADIALHTSDQVAASARDDKKMGSEEKLADKKIGAEKGIRDADRTLEYAKLDEMREYHQGLVKRGLGAKTAGLDPQLKAQLDVLEDEAKGHLSTAEKFAGMADKTEDPSVARTYRQRSEAALTQLDRVNQERERLVNVAVPREAPGGGPAVKDRFASSPLTQADGEAEAATPPGEKPAGEKPTGILHSVERKRPISPRGYTDPKSAKANQIERGQLDYDIQELEKEIEQAKVHAGPKRLQYLQNELARLQKRKAQATEGK